MTWDELMERISIRCNIERGRDPGLVMRDIEDDLREFKRDARRRITENLMHQLGDRERYFHEPEFKAMIDLLALMTWAAAFDEVPLTEKEKQERMRTVNFAMDEAIKMFGTT
jgi:hypothetical protein